MKVGDLKQSVIKACIEVQALMTDFIYQFLMTVVD